MIDSMKNRKLIEQLHVYGGVLYEWQIVCTSNNKIDIWVATGRFSSFFASGIFFILEWMALDRSFVCAHDCCGICHDEEKSGAVTKAPKC